MARPRGHGPGFEARRQSIIDSAAAIFAQHGYAAVGISELGKQVDLGKGALYYYIGSKEELLVEIQDRVLAPLLTSARRIVELEVDPLMRIRVLSEVLLDLILRRLDHVWVYEHDYRQLTGERRTKVLAQRREFQSIARHLVEEAMADRLLDEVEPELATLEFLNLHNHTYQWAHTHTQWTASDLSQSYCRLFLTGKGGSVERVEQLEQDVATFWAAYEGPPLTAH